jgi:hypothetical protein
MARGADVESAHIDPSDIILFSVLISLGIYFSMSFGSQSDDALTLLFFNFLRLLIAVGLGCVAAGICREARVLANREKSEVLDRLNYQICATNEQRGAVVSIITRDWWSLSCDSLTSFLFKQGEYLYAGSGKAAFCVRVSEDIKIDIMPKFTSNSDSVVRLFEGWRNDIKYENRVIKEICSEFCGVTETDLRRAVHHLMGHLGGVVTSDKLWLIVGNKAVNALIPFSQALLLYDTVRFLGEDMVWFYRRKSGEGGCYVAPTDSHIGINWSVAFTDRKDLSGATLCEPGTVVVYAGGDSVRDFVWKNYPEWGLIRAALDDES